MINSSRLIENFLQNYRFKIVKPYLNGDVLDFGGNKGELKKFVHGEYFLINYDHSSMVNIYCDTIVSLAVIEHIPVKDVVEVFQRFKMILRKNGKIFITTPTQMAKPVLELWAYIGIVDKENIKEHQHYWSKKEIYDLASVTGFKIKKYKIFQLGFNQFSIFEHK